jgi:hypothetical protein
MRENFSEKYHKAIAKCQKFLCTGPLWGQIPKSASRILTLPSWAGRVRGYIYVYKLYSIEFNQSLASSKKPNEEVILRIRSRVSNEYQNRMSFTKRGNVSHILDSTQRSSLDVQTWISTLQHVCTWGLPFDCQGCAIFSVRESKRKPAQRSTWQWDGVWYLMDNDEAEDGNTDWCGGFLTSKQISLKFVHGGLTALCILPLVAMSDVLVALTEVADGADAVRHFPEFCLFWEMTCKGRLFARFH